eukprot:CFRG5298T1
MSLDTTPRYGTSGDTEAHVQSFKINQELLDKQQHVIALTDRLSKAAKIFLEHEKRYEEHTTWLNEAKQMVYYSRDESSPLYNEGVSGETHVDEKCEDVGQLNRPIEEYLKQRGENLSDTLSLLRTYNKRLEEVKNVKEKLKKRVEICDNLDAEVFAMETERMKDLQVHVTSKCNKALERENKKLERKLEERTSAQYEIINEHIVETSTATPPVAPLSDENSLLTGTH